ncbi:Ras And Rab Interactor 2 [Manis pentadactyla]|nr:Ras And Rab Interactor 2 [Manis pentadactyla]
MARSHVLLVMTSQEAVDFRAGKRDRGAYWGQETASPGRSSSVRGSPERQPRGTGPRDSRWPPRPRAHGTGRCREARPRAGTQTWLRAFQPVAAGPRTVRRGARTQGAGLPAARGKVELGEVGSGGGAPRGGHRGVVSSAREHGRRRRDPETPGARSPEQAGYAAALLP